MDKHICPECGLDYGSDAMEEHLLSEHGIVSRQKSFIEQEEEMMKDLKDIGREEVILAYKKNAEDQMQAELIEMDRTTRYKADQYDRITKMFFMSCGVVEDGDSFKYIVDPETVAEELMKIVIEDIHVDRTDFEQRKINFFNGRRIKPW